MRFICRAGTLVLVPLALACHGGASDQSAADASADTDTQTHVDHGDDGDNSDGSHDTDQADTDHGSHGGFDPAALAETFAEAYCTYRDTCESVNIDYIPETPQECVTDQKAAQLDQWNALAPFVAAGTVTFSQADFDACIADLTSALDDCEVGRDPTACADMFHGSVVDGDPCGTDAECGEGSWCDGDYDACGVCTQMLGANDDCATGGECATGLACIVVNAQGAAECLPDTANVGDSCGTLSTGLCRGALQCVGDGNYACTRPAGPGDGCDTTGITPDCNINVGEICGSDQTCVPLTIVGASEDCGTAAPTQICDGDSTCDATSNTCTAFAAVDHACSATKPCADDEWCKYASSAATTGTCKAQHATGAHCTDSQECAGDDYCDAGTCGLLEYVQTCESASP